MCRVFGTFQSKADVCQGFGYFGPETRKRLELISSVRNRFAHAERAIDFHDAKVLAPCEKLGLGAVQPDGAKPTTSELRRDFISLVKTLTERLRRHWYHVPELDEPPPVLP